MKIKSFDKTAVRSLRTEIQTSLDRIAKANGISLSLGTLRFTPNDFRVKLTGNVGQNLFNTFVPNSTATPNSSLSRYGLKPEAFGKPFMLGGTRYILTGVKPSRPKWPFVGTGPQGGRYKFQASSVRNGLLDRSLVI